MGSRKIIFILFCSNFLFLGNAKALQLQCEEVFSKKPYTVSDVFNHDPDSLIKSITYTDPDGPQTLSPKLVTQAFLAWLQFMDWKDFYFLTYNKLNPIDATEDYAKRSHHKLSFDSISVQHDGKIFPLSAYMNNEQLVLTWADGIIKNISLAQLVQPEVIKKQVQETVMTGFLRKTKKIVTKEISELGSRDMIISTQFMVQDKNSLPEIAVVTRNGRLFRINPWQGELIENSSVITNFKATGATIIDSHTMIITGDYYTCVVDPLTLELKAIRANNEMLKTKAPRKPLFYPRYFGDGTYFIAENDISELTIFDTKTLDAVISFRTSLRETVALETLRHAKDYKLPSRKIDFDLDNVLPPFQKVDLSVITRYSENNYFLTHTQEAIDLIQRLSETMSIFELLIPAYTRTISMLEPAVSATLTPIVVVPYNFKADLRIFKDDNLLESFFDLKSKTLQHALTPPDQRFQLLALNIWTQYLLQCGWPSHVAIVDRRGKKTPVFFGSDVELMTKRTHKLDANIELIREIESDPEKLAFILSYFLTLATDHLQQKKSDILASRNSHSKDMKLLTFLTQQAHRYAAFAPGNATDFNVGFKSNAQKILGERHQLSLVPEFRAQPHALPKLPEVQKPRYFSEKQMEHFFSSLFLEDLKTYASDVPDVVSQLTHDYLQIRPDLENVPLNIEKQIAEIRESQIQTTTFLTAAHFQTWLDSFKEQIKGIEKRKSLLNPIYKRAISLQTLLNRYIKALYEDDYFKRLTDDQREAKAMELREYVAPTTLLASNTETRMLNLEHQENIIKKMIHLLGLIALRDGNQKEQILKLLNEYQDLLNPKSQALAPGGTRSTGPR